MWPCGSGFSLFCVLFSRFIHVTAGDSTSFISMAEYYSMIWMYHLAFTHSSVDGTFYSWGYWGLEERRKSSYWTTFGVSDLWETAWHLPTFPIGLRSSSLLLNSQSRKLLSQTTALPAFLLWPHLFLCFVQVVLFWCPETMKAGSELMRK